MSSRPTRMKSVMSAVAVLKNFHGLSSQASIRIPAAVKTRRGEVMRIVSTAMPMAKAEGPASCRIRFCRARETTVPRAPRATRTAPMASCLRVDRCGTGSGMSRIARTMFSFDTRNDAIPIVAIVMRNPIAKPVSRSEMVHVSTSPPPNPPWKTWEKPHRMTPAMRRHPNMPTTEERRAYRSPSDTKLWTRFFRRMPRARATPISPLRSSASMTKMLTIRRMPAMIVKKLRRTNTWERRSAPSVAPLTESAFACATVKDGDVGRCDSSCDAAASDRRSPCSAPPTFAPRTTLICSVEPDQVHGWFEQARPAVDRRAAQMDARRHRGDVGHRRQVRRQGLVDADVEGDATPVWGAHGDRFIDQVEGSEDPAPDRVVERALDHERRGHDRGADQEARDDDRHLRLAAEEVPHADPQGEALAAGPSDDGEGRGGDDEEEGQVGVHPPHPAAAGWKDF